MRLGVSLPHDASTTDPAALREFIQTVEGLGFDYFTVADHVVGADPTNRPGWSGEYTHRVPMREPLAVLAFAAACTTRLTLGTSVIILPQRQTVLVAKQMAELDTLSGGRVFLGAGLGWNEVEYEALNENFRNRAWRIEEQIAVLRALWTKDVVTFEGEWHRIIEAGINPMPRQRPIPIWMGGSADAAVRRIARLADGWNCGTVNLAEAPATLQRFRQYAREAGRDPSSVGLAPRLGLAGGTPADWLKTYQAWRDLGVSHVGITTNRTGAETVDQHLALVRRFKETVDAAA